MGPWFGVRLREVVGKHFGPEQGAPGLRTVFQVGCLSTDTSFFRQTIPVYFSILLSL